jgi:adenine-specific DNA-methyltransferase
VREIVRASAGAEAERVAWAVAVRVAEARGLAPVEDEEARRLARFLPDLPWATLGGEIAGAVYEALLAPGARRRFGVHYTPREVADYLVARAWRGGPLVDPACGAGSFLLAAARACGGDRARLCEVRAFDLDPAAAALAAEVLALETAGGDVERARRFWRERIRAGDALRLVRGPVDAVVGNPPFFAATGRPDLQAFARKRFPAVYSGRNDASHFFVALGLEVLRPGGRLAMVLPGYFLENTFAAGLRAALAAAAGEVEVVDLQAVRLFGAKVHAVLLVAERSGPVRRRRLAAPAGTSRAAVLADLAAMAAGRAPAVLRAADEAPEGWLERVGAHPPLQSLCRIEKGCETGRNEVFVVAEERARALGLEPAALRPLVKGRHISPFRIERSGEVLIYLDGRVPLDELPRVRAYLEPFRSVLLQRAECRDGRYPWWRMHRPRDPVLADAPAKVVVPYRAAAPAFAVDRRGALNDGGDVRFLIPARGVDPDYLCGILNSAVVRTWLEWRGKRKGHLFEFFREPLARIPVPPGPRHAPAIAALAREVARGVEARAELERQVAAAYGVEEPP